ncbi:DUF5009 domain-containing protein [Chitinophaga lutea]|uniref:DUF5009 domain-containing protein n=1 Tax=Chitinophaga lutea TaxID=2488634 RepID=A0A3N4PPH7_9BACT|nr:DUF5009 domain-containing protein [Chitinophaga lutea]RPE05670.1 DUF5009 domain-containing protein [Chitinophaga lutea]
MTVSQRIASIDITRAITMLMMIFVNDLWTLHDIPAWLEHTAANDDGMGLADTVFPAFLFIVGMSIPYAIASRIKKGDNRLRLVRHVLERSVALLVMGLFLVNGEYINGPLTGIGKGGWNVLSCICFILIWNQYPQRFPRLAVNILKGVGIVALALLAYIYRGGEAGITFSTHWWGILGLIGWAYLVTALIYVLGRGSLTVNFVAWVIFIGCSMLAHGGVTSSGSILRTLLDPLEDGAMPTLVLAGVIVSQLFRQYAAAGKWQAVTAVLSAIAVVWLAAGFVTRPVWGISKILATPSWVLICSGITTFLFIAIYWLCDLKNKASWFDIIRPAGSDTLLCYLVPYFVYALMGAAGLFGVIQLGGIVGLFKSLLFAIVVIQIARGLTKAGIRLKL